MQERHRKKHTESKSDKIFYVENDLLKCANHDNYRKKVMLNISPF